MQLFKSIMIIFTVFFTIVNQGFGQWEKQSFPSEENLYRVRFIPVTPSTTISFILHQSEFVSLAIFNCRGQRVKTLVNKKLLSGEQSFAWDGKNEARNALPSGLYFYKLTTPESQLVNKMLLIR